MLARLFKPEQDQQLKNSIFNDIQNLFNDCLKNYHADADDKAQLEKEIKKSLLSIETILDADRLDLNNILPKLNKISHDYAKFIERTDSGSFTKVEYTASLFISGLIGLPDLLRILDSNAEVPVNIIPEEYFLEVHSDLINYSSIQEFIDLAIYLENKNFLKYLIEAKNIPLQEVGADIFSAAVASNSLEMLKYIVDTMTLQKLNHHLNPEKNYYGIWSNKAILFLNLMKTSPAIKTYIMDELKITLDADTLESLIAIHVREQLDYRFGASTLQDVFTHYSKQILELDHQAGVNIIMEILEWSDQVDLVNTFMQMTHIQLTTEDLAKIESSLKDQLSLYMDWGNKQVEEKITKTVAQKIVDFKALIDNKNEEKCDKEEEKPRLN